MESKDMIMLAIAGGVAYWLYSNKEKFDPTSDKNLAYELTNKALGYDNKTASIGTTAYEKVQKTKKALGMDYDHSVDDDFLNKPTPKTESSSIGTTAYEAVQKTKKALGMDYDHSVDDDFLNKPAPVSTSMAAMTSNGKWYAQDKGKWRPLNRNEKVFNVHGHYVVNDWKWVPPT